MLRMAKTEEKRERIKWFYARRVFFRCNDTSCSDGLVLARDCHHEDACFLASLFPGNAPSTVEAAVTFLNHNDPRCMCWAVQCGAVPNYKLLQRSAEAGYSWGQMYFADLDEPARRTMWLEKAVAQGDADAMYRLGRAFVEEGQTLEEEDFVPQRTNELWLEAALLGHPSAQWQCANAHSVIPKSMEQFVWTKRAASQNFHQSVEMLFLCLDSRNERPSPREMFGIGEALSCGTEWKKRRRYGARTSAVDEAVRLYDGWCDKARRAVLCWLWLAKENRVVKDIRVMIAGLIWDERAAWSERIVEIEPVAQKAKVASSSMRLS